MKTPISWSIQTCHVFPQFSSFCSLFRSEQIPDHRFIDRYQCNELPYEFSLCALQPKMWQEHGQYMLNLCVGHLPDVSRSLLRIIGLVFASLSTKRFAEKIWDNRTGFRQAHFGRVGDAFPAIFTGRRGNVSTDGKKTISVESTSEICKACFQVSMPPLKRDVHIHADEGRAETVMQGGGRTPKAGGRLFQGRKWNEMPQLAGRKVEHV